MSWYTSECDRMRRQIHRETLTTMVNLLTVVSHHTQNYAKHTLDVVEWNPSKKQTAYLKDLLYFLIMYTSLSVCVYRCSWRPVALDAMELDLEVVVSCPTWGSRTEPGPTVRTARATNHRAINLTTKLHLFHQKLYTMFVHCFRYKTIYKTRTLLYTHI